MRSVRETGLSAVQLALDPIRAGGWDEGRTRDVLADAGIAILSGMMGTIGEDYTTLESIRETGGVRPNAHWASNLANARSVAAIAGRLGVRLVTFHAGFLPHEAPAGSRDAAERATMLERLRTLADVFAGEGVKLGLETGQESAATLLTALQELNHPNVGVNFDPANMILYGMGDPIESLRLLAPHVVQIHLKDAVPAAVLGTWGQEVPIGAGAVDWKRFFDVYRQTGLKVDLVIEREAGDARVADIRRGRAHINGLF